ncbi:Sodium/potassium/calcium exchanger 4 [Trichoplax sp. H2]|nr:Sodium/potassium/calcium exchanger 4 [Trichoplax sp. H2]|eukprot:RDD42636.1 Sodium/potassium/calcium exchanger 4 [Trichoplax sp. H2]
MAFGCLPSWTMLKTVVVYPRISYNGWIIILISFLLILPTTWTLPGSIQDVHIANQKFTTTTTNLPSQTWSSPDFDANGRIYNQSTNCTLPGIDEFPKDIFTQQQRRQGAVVIHFIVAFYMFAALAVVCDEYFVASLEVICERFNFSDDVAGATFMAAGSSAPELFTSIIGVFITKGDVGVGTIVGSAVFNILFIIGICGIFAKETIHLTVWPLFRDSFFYILSIIGLFLVMYDGYVTWYTSLCLLILYIGYIVLMKNNEVIHSFVSTCRCNNYYERNREERSRLLANSRGYDEEEQLIYESTPYVREKPLKSLKIRSIWDAAVRLMITRRFSPATRFRFACRNIITHKEIQRSYSNPDHVTWSMKTMSIFDSEESLMLRNGSSSSRKSEEKFITAEVITLEHSSHYNAVKSFFAVLKMVGVYPICLLLALTVPDCRNERWTRWYMVTFIMSVVWIAGFSYILVWMVTVIGFTFGIPDTVMGLTLLAAGTSVPDAIASLIVARQGSGDMAVSNSVGSNIFDILLGLGLPWFLRTTIYSTTVKINSRGLTLSVMLLCANVVLMFICIHCNKWKLNKKLGVIFLFLYCVFIVISMLIEFNVFMYVNPPTCPV